MQRLLRAERAAQAALIACSIMVPFMMVAAGLLSIDGGLALRLGDLKFAFLIAVFAYLYGLLPVALYGAPLYALLEMKGLAKWPFVIAVGVAPGIALVLIASTTFDDHPNSRLSIGLLATVSGILISVITHWLRTRTGPSLGDAQQIAAAGGDP